MIVHCFVATVNGPLCYKSHGWLALLADLRRHDPLCILQQLIRKATT